MALDRTLPRSSGRVRLPSLGTLSFVALNAILALVLFAYLRSARSPLRLGVTRFDPAAAREILRLGLAATLSPFVEPMRERGSGTLAGIASVAGFRGLPGNGAYSASKAAAINWLEALRVELHSSGVRVVTVCPGYIETPLTAANRFPMPFLISAEDAAWRTAR
jgi:NAD(P)-dependent dehydrogenase (short-subunit alcohol dehydrogenase family)